MSLALNKRNWWEGSGDKLWALNLRRSNFVSLGDKCDRWKPGLSEARTFIPELVPHGDEEMVISGERSDR